MNPSKTARKSMGEWDSHTRIILLLSSMKPAICLTVEENAGMPENYVDL
jgi:hypothetical protein